MSRIIVKNLPKGITSQKIKEVFGTKGIITDIQLKHKDGKFRQFGFVGYENDESAAEAVKYFNNTFINTSKISVEICSALGDEKPKSWGKHSKEKEKKDVVASEPDPISEDNIKAKKKGNVIEEIVGDHKNDPLFVEFMQTHAKDQTIWNNDLTGPAENETEQEIEEETPQEKIADKKEVSDADYMKSLMQDSQESVKVTSKKPKEMIELFTVKIRNVPKKVKREELIKFFRPAKAASVRIPSKGKGIDCFAYVGFKTERDLQKALLKDKSFLKGKQVHVYDFTKKNKLPTKPDGSSSVNPRWLQQEEMLRNEETICDSGKLFFRNLAYTVTEDNVQKLFDKYGQITEINIPIDPVSKKIKGFGTVIFMLPEHAVRAYNELNGTLFHGRMFHILPGKSNDEIESANSNSTNYKQKKEQELKKSAGSSHNWNTLFLGANAVAEVLAKTYGKSKEEVLGSSDGSSGAAVRLALGETQIVLEMKKFLEDNGVYLDAFDDIKSKRSKLIILVKNLPANTDVSEIQTIFEKFGTLGRVLLPPSGVTALVEFTEFSEARKAFKKLAYTKFKNVPLYLEWAPENTFVSADIKVKKSDENKADSKQELSTENLLESPVSKEIEKTDEIEEEKEEAEAEDEEEDDDEPPEPETTLFIKNLNFSTNESAVKEHFKHLGPIHTIQIARKKNPESNELQTLGYGFIQFKKASAAEKALKTMQMTRIDDKVIELKRSDRTLQQTTAQSNRKQVKKRQQKNSTKIMVRNIPFQANQNEVRDIFKVFGEIKALRLPKKMVPGAESHRGFGFVDYCNKNDAKNAFEALQHSTHLYGRRLVLEWADSDENIDVIRKRTADQYHGSEAKKSRKSVFKSDQISVNVSNEDDDE